MKHLSEDAEGLQTETWGILTFKNRVRGKALKSLRSIQTYLTKENVSAEVQEEEKFLKWDFCIAKPKV